MHISRRIFAIMIVSTMIALDNSCCQAELSPESYMRFQEAAPEALTIDVLEVQVVRTKSPDATVSDVRVVAKIAHVERSAKGYRVGQKIIIRYSSTERKIAIVGPAEIPVLKAGETLPAFLEAHDDGASLTPAAKSRSFSEYQAKRLPKVN